MSNAYQYNKGKSYHPLWSNREDTNSNTLVKSYSTLIPIKYNYSDPRNKGSHKTQISHKKLSPLQLHNESDSRSEKFIMKNLHKPSMINLINNPQIITHAHEIRISSTNTSWSTFFVIISFFFLFCMRIPWSSIHHTPMRHCKE